MIPKTLGLLLSLSWLQAVYGAAYSKVYVQNGAEVVPVEYINYGAPSVVTNRQIAALSAPPIGSALPLPNVVTPCVAPCVVPSQTVGTFARVPNAKIIYNAPSVPAVVVPTNDEASSYEYSYVVYDEDTGDKKAQRELSDGSVVHGEYSFIQPDGYVREVKYTADDLTGFNAVVKSFLPESVFGIDKKKPETKEKSEPPPCKETKSEALKVKPDHGQAEQPNSEPSEAHESVPEPHDTEAHIELSVVPVDHTPAEHVSEHAVEQPAVHEIVISHDNKHPPEPTADHSGETPAEHAQHSPQLASDHAPELVPENAPQPAPELVAENASQHAPEHAPENIPEHANEAHSEHIEIIVETPAEHAKHGPHHIEVAHPIEVTKPSPEPAHAEAEQHAEPVTQPSPVELVQAAKEDSDQKTPAAIQSPAPQISIPNGLATYSDIFRCIQAAMANKDANAPSFSPLTYIILPAANKLC